MPQDEFLRHIFWYHRLMFESLVLGLLILMTLLIAISAVAVFILRVPFVSTPPHIADAMFGLIDWQGKEVVVDLGCGDGRLLERLKKKLPDTTVTGCELSPVVWLAGIIRSLVLRTGVRIRFRSVFRQNVSRADVVVLYLFPHLMQALEDKLDRELQPGTFVLCQTFGFPGRRAEKIVRVPRFGSQVSVFLYRWPAQP